MPSLRGMESRLALTSVPATGGEFQVIRLGEFPLTLLIGNSCSRHPMSSAWDLMIVSWKGGVSGE
jgi:hypothetical protein